MNIIFDHVLLPAGGADLVGEPGGHLHGGEQPDEGANQAKERTTTDYVFEEARM